jgi:hypothetical protein
MLDIVHTLGLKPREAAKLGHESSLNMQACRAAASRNREGATGRPKPLQAPRPAGHQMRRTPIRHRPWHARLAAPEEVPLQQQPHLQRQKLLEGQPSPALLQVLRALRLKQALQAPAAQAGRHGGG